MCVFLQSDYHLIVQFFFLCVDWVFFLVLSDINYFHCVRIVELLKVSESSSKNIFGGYSSKRMKVSVKEWR